MMPMAGCTHRRAMFYAIQTWRHRPDVVLFNCPDCKGTFALETLVALWREQESASIPRRYEPVLAPAS